MESSSSGSSKACLNKPTSTFNHFTPTRPASAHTNPFRHFLKRPREEEQKLELNVKMETEDSIQVIPDGDGLNQPITIDSPLLLESGSLESSSSKFRSQEPPQQPAAHEALPLTRSLIKSPSPSDQERFQPLVTPQFNPISNALFMKSVSGPEFIDLTGSSSPFLPSVGAVAPVSPTIRSPEVIAESKRIAEKKREAAAAAKERE